VDRASAQIWLDNYVAAWLSYDEGDIRALFTSDIAYRYHPYDDPIVGREAVVASWLGKSDSDEASTRDAPGTYSVRYAPVAVDDDVVVATGTSRYSERPAGPIVRTYHNCFVMRLTTKSDAANSPSTTFGCHCRATGRVPSADIRLWSSDPLPSPARSLASMAREFWIRIPIVINTVTASLTARTWRRMPHLHGTTRHDR
jgi:hypothetical protein